MKTKRYSKKTKIF